MSVRKSAGGTFLGVIMVFSEDVILKISFIKILLLLLLLLVYCIVFFIVDVFCLG